MYVIGMIFKIIGILLLVLLGIVLVLLLSVLFVPIRYKFCWEKQPEDSHCVQATLSWCLRILALSMEYQEQFSYRIRVFGIPIKKGTFQQGEETEEEEETKEQVFDDFFDDLDREVSWKDREEETYEEEKGLANKLENPQETEDCGRENIQKDKFFKNKTGKKENTKNKNIDMDANAQEFEIRLPKPSKKKLHVFESCLHKVKQWIAFLKKIPTFFQSLFYKVRDLWQNVDDSRGHLMEKMHIVLDFWRGEENQAGKQLIFNKGKKIFRHITPRKCKGYIRFGLADPASTGQALAVISIISGLVGRMPNIEPDFSKKILEGRFYCCGRLQMAYLLWLGFRLWFHEDVKKVKDNFKKVRRAF